MGVGEMLLLPANQLIAAPSVGMLRHAADVAFPLRRDPPGNQQVRGAQRGRQRQGGDALPFD